MVVAACGSSSDEGGPAVVADQPVVEATDDAQGEEPTDLLPEDAAVLDELRELGEDLDQPRVIEHFLIFTDEASATAASEESELLGCNSEILAPVPEDPDGWLLLCTIDVIASDDVVAILRDSLEEIAVRHGGIYDGWGSPLN